MPKVEQPSFPDYTVSILQFGAKSDGTTLNTKAINDAIKAVNAKGGGKVVIPEGLWLTGPIELLSNVNLHTEKMLSLSLQMISMPIPFLRHRLKG